MYLEYKNHATAKCLDWVYKHARPMVKGMPNNKLEKVYALEDLLLCLFDKSRSEKLTVKPSGKETKCSVPYLCSIEQICLQIMKKYFFRGQRPRRTTSDEVGFRARHLLSFSRGQRMQVLFARFREKVGLRNFRFSQRCRGEWFWSENVPNPCKHITHYRRRHY